VGLVVPLGNERPQDSSSIEPLQQLVAEDLAAVNRVIVARMQSRVALIPELAGYIVAAGGKRIRPMLTIAGAKICGYAGDRHVELAACVEFIHTATLLHDDVVDESELRRGNATAHAVWGNPASVLVGDFLFSRAFQLMVEDGSLRVLEILSGASAVIAEGEVWQLATTNNPETSEDSYLDVITAKTAALFAAACQIGSVLAARPRPEEEALESYGRNLGVAFQLVDDALDYSARQPSFGKSVGDDFREGKMTLPILLAYRRGSHEEREFWRRTLERGEQTDSDFDSACAILGRHGALRDTVERARHYGAIARDALGIFADGEPKRAMMEVVDFCIERAH
jgi:octaprenyl-diphosphate synthase